MCLVVVAWRQHPVQDLVVAANRDELHARAAAPLDHWAELPDVAGGRDLVAGGSWLGVDGRGRFACVTNYRGEPSGAGTPRTRGRLVSDFLAGTATAGDYVARLATTLATAADHPGFNLLVADGSSLWYASNRWQGFARQLGAGVHGLSNDVLDTAWPKVELSRQGLRAALDTGAPAPATLFALLAQREPGGPPAPAGLPWPATSGPFIAHPRYGTRCSTVVLRQADSTWIGERRFGPGGEPQGSSALCIRRMP